MASILNFPSSRTLHLATVLGEQLLELPLSVRPAPPAILDRFAVHQIGIGDVLTLRADDRHDVVDIFAELVRMDMQEHGEGKHHVRFRSRHLGDRLQAK